MPIKEISAESVRDKSIRHGHISTLHLWWARRPLPVCRAIVFASLVPDPLDDDCPVAFRDAVDAIIGNGCPDAKVRSEYCPYDDIPYTAIYDPMEDNLRNRLMMFIGRFSPACSENMKNGKATPPKGQLSDGSLIKWENKNNPRILRMARELLWVAYNADKRPNAGYETLHREFSEAFDAITAAENELYTVKDRHVESEEVKKLETALQQAIDNFQNQMPSVFDPFAGGGAIPLEAARLGCRSFGNDINPVAHIIERGSAEFPQKYGKPIIYSLEEFKKLYGDIGIEMAGKSERDIYWNGKAQTYTIFNRLAFDVEFYARQILAETEKEVGNLYPRDDKGNSPIAFYWARTAKCSNPSCGAEVPMLKQFYLANTSNKKVYLNPIIKGTDIRFEVKVGTYEHIKGWNNRGNITCPCCGSITSVNDVKNDFCKNGIKSRLLAVISEGYGCKSYSIPIEEQTSIVSASIKGVERGKEKMERNSNGGDTFTWGFSKWSDLFSDRQLNTLYAFVRQIRKLSETLGSSDYANTVITYLSIWLDRISLANTSLGRWHNGRETVEHPFSRQAIAMTFDYPESNPFCSSSGSALNQLEWILRYIESESSGSFPSTFANASSGEKEQFETKSLTAVITDPPYYDAIAYADISDFFYVWLKRTLADIYPINFATPQTPKAEECTALKHHHNNSEKEAKAHFENKLTEIFDAIEQQTSDVVSIMFAHQSTTAWTTLCNSILGARMNITGSWPMDTEMANRSLGLAGAALESSVTVSCRPSERKGFGEFRDVKRDIEKKVADEVEKLYSLGFRGADLLTACFGQAVSEFGCYKTVEKADGSEVSVGELLDLAKSSAFEALIKGVQGDDYTRFYVGWLYINGAGESDFDDATKFTRVGVNVDIKEILQKKLLILEGKKIHLSMSEEHFRSKSEDGVGVSSVEGTRPTDSPINQAHRAIILWRQQDRIRILRFVRDIAPEKESSLWRLLATLKELLPAGDELKQVQGLLQNSEDLRQHCHDEKIPTQQELNFQTT